MNLNDENNLYHINEYGYDNECGYDNNEYEYNENDNSRNDNDNDESRSENRNRNGNSEDENESNDRNCNNNASSASSKNFRKRLSLVYNFFTFEPSDDRWHCISCSSNFADKATTTLWRHVQKNHPSQINKNESIDKEKEKFTQEGFRKKLLRWIIMDDQPFVVVQNEAFRKMITYLHGDVNIPSSEKIRRDLSETFNEVKELVRKELQESPGLLSFTIDAWTSRNQLPFLGISVHWIDENWGLRNVLLDFCVLAGPHSGENLAKKFLDTLQDYNLFTKILAISCDNASNMDVMLHKISNALNYYNINIKFDEENQRVRCLAHVINLAAKKVLENLKASGPDEDINLLEENDINENLSNVVHKIRILITKIRASPQRREKFKQQCIAVGCNTLELMPDIRTRWNSTEMMIERAIELKNPLHNLASVERDLRIYVLSDDEWNCLEEIRNLMQHFKKATDFISGQLYPTLAFSVPVYNYLIDKIEDEIDSPITKPYIKEAALAAAEKIKEYYPTTNGQIYIIATIMDPRLKLQYYKNNEWEEEYVVEAERVVTYVWENNYKENFFNDCHNSISKNNTCDELFSHIFKNQNAIQNDNELKIYLREPVVDTKTDVLSWWKLHQTQYPSLSKMAQDYLAIPATSAPIERIFSGGTDLVVQRRCSLKGETIRESMCLKNWYKSGFAIL